ncbi:hypothetical protein HMPREF0083_03629 [Aneurinibacillus aneurinilyticus ATCC 12856]|uniref:Uncharacterized protein n=1 Tax=Aneurinibacillus aneurinilyticus ATCC 12856 TaxID=649747 RepID=U1Y865_ANEAE|nr:hypothetical protein HMPREF0083_03629 [Aneurinibacillus aneurinilyticus ATCC 12856]
MPILSFAGSFHQAYGMRTGHGTVVVSFLRALRKRNKHGAVPCPCLCYGIERTASSRDISYMCKNLRC